MKLKLFAPNLNVIFGISTQITSLSTKSMHERGGVLQLDKYRGWLRRLKDDRLERTL